MYMGRRTTVTYCPTCGRALEADARFCGGCGRAIGEHGTPSKRPSLFQALIRRFAKKPVAVKQLRALVKQHRPLVGHTVCLGSYPQTADGRQMPIEWQVIAEEGGRVLLLSRYGIDMRRYHEQKAPISWEYSDIRRYLNGRFADRAFSALERKHIVSTFVRTERSELYRYEDGHVTRDRIFLLSREEAETYLPTETSRVTTPTPYAVRRGVLAHAEGSCRWWLRTPGRKATSVCCVGYGGAIHGVGNYVNFDIPALRPAMWITL